MRNQIKKMMKKENGFTLVELLAVLAILAIIVAIAIPAVGSIVSNAEDSASNSEKELVEDAARLYFLDNAESKKNPVTTTDLEEAGYLDPADDAPDLSFTQDDEGNVNPTVE